MTVHHQEIDGRQCVHRLYRLSCEEYEALHERSGGLCECCGIEPQRDIHGRRLMIDHDHQRGTGRDHVRGLVCRSCNARLGLVDASVQAPTAEEARYLGDAWFLSHPPARQVVYDPADESAAYAELDAASANYLAALAGRDAARDALREGIVRHLRERSGPPGKLAEHTPYDRNHVGRIGRDHGVPPLRPQPTPTRKRKA